MNFTCLVVIKLYVRKIGRVKCVGTCLLVFLPQGGADAGKERLGGQVGPKSEFNASFAVHSKILCQIINHNTGRLKTLFG